MDYENLAKQGSALGSAAVIVIGANQSLVEVARRTLAFFARKAAASVRRVREGTPWLEAILERIERGEGRVEDIALMTYIADMIGGKSFCPFGYAAIWGLQSNLAKFRPSSTPPSPAATAQPVIPVRPTSADAGVPSGVTQASLSLEEKYNKPSVKR